MSGIEWNHPLAVACRDTDSLAEEYGLEGTIDRLDMGGLENVNYVARQRALRALAVMKGQKIVLGGPANVGPEDEEVFSILHAAYLDGLAIGWRAHEEVTLGEDE